MSRSSGISPQAVSLPKGGGDVRGLGGAFLPDCNRGTGSYVLDLRLPPGPGGIRPSLALAYSSAAGNGAFGLGWDVAVPTLYRDSERHFVRYDDTDGFRLAGQGELVLIGDGSFRPKYDTLFARITRGDHWEVSPKEGGVQRFGLDAEGRLGDPDDPNRVLAWLLQEVEDRNGNPIRFRYLSDGNNRYLREAAWGPYRLAFVYGPRPDVFSTARHGFTLTTALRCVAIELHCDRLPGHTLIRRYTLDYLQPDETPLSMLREVRLSGHRGQDADAGDTMPPLTFGYSTWQPASFRCRPLANPDGAPLPNLGASTTDLVDCTGDGLPDFVQIDGERRVYWANRGDGTFDAPRQIRSLPDGAHLGNPGIGFGDLDGEGAAGLFTCDGPYAGYFPRTGPATWGPLRRFPSAPATSLRDPSTRMIDLDADGRVDLLRTTDSAFLLYLNRGADGWEALPPIPRVHDFETFPDISLSDSRVQLADMTGDGLPDIVLIRPGEVCYWPYEGLGRWGRRRVLAGAPAFARPGASRAVFLSDVNGDGVADLVVVEGDAVTIWINRCGIGFAPPVRLANTPAMAGADIRVADMLGTGTGGVLWTYASEVRPRTRCFFLDLAGKAKPYLLTSVDNGLGKRTTIRYETSSRYAGRDRKEGRPWTTSLPFPVQVVAEIRQDDAASLLSLRQTLAYRDGLYDGRERRFAGFARVGVTEWGEASAPPLLSAMHFAAQPTAEMGDDARAMAVAQWGRLLETAQGPPDGPPLRRATGTWTATIAARGEDGTPVVTIARTALRTEQLDGTGESAEAAEAVIVEHTYSFDEAGNVTSQRRQANGPAPVVVTSSVEYAHAANGRLTSLPSRVVERDADGVMLRERRIYYDGDAFTGLPLGQAGAGNLMRQSVRVIDAEAFAAHYGAEGLDAATLGYRLEPDAPGSWWRDEIRYAYDALGNIAQSRDALGNESTIERDADGLHPVRVVDAAGHATTLHWDDAALQPDTVTDSNGAVFRFGFDALGRVTRLMLPRVVPGPDPGIEADPDESVAYHLNATPPYVELTQKADDGLPAAARRMYYDGSGQVLQSRTLIDDEADPESVLVSAARTINARGWLGTIGEPTFSQGLTFAPVPPTVVTALHYDALGRTLGADLPGGRTTRTVFKPFSTTLYDANDTDASPENIARGFFDTPTTHDFDGLGRLAAVTERHDGVATRHAFRHDDAGQLREISGPDGGVLVSRRLDLAGQLLELDHRDGGRRLFFHDAAGRLVRTVDAAGQRITHAWDALGRLTTTSVDGNVLQQFGYDQAGTPYGIGRMTEATDESGTWHFAYDARGRMTHRTLTANGRSWTLAQQYLANGQVSETTYPDGATLAFRYDRAGRLKDVPGILDAIAYDALGRRTSMQYSNGVQTRIEYDPQRRFLSRLRVLDANAAVLQDTTYTRDNVGNVLAHADGRPAGPGAPHPRRFTLDGRYRLVAVDGGGSAAVPAYTRLYAYDPANNVTRFPTHGAAPLVCDPPGSNRIAGILDGGNLVRLYEYDANGNVTRLPGRKLSFDGLGRMTSVRRDDGASVTYRYSATGERTWRETSIAGAVRRTLFLGGYEEDDDGTIRRYLSAAGMPVAVDRGGVRTWLHGNELGHITLLTDAAGVLAGSRHLQPFGEDAGQGTAGATVPYAFGAQMLDDVSGLYHFGARYYAPEIGRFVSPDPLYLLSPELALQAPGLLNPYAYGLNNPMIYADPSGLSPVGAALGGLVGGALGALVFVVTSGNPIAAGLVGGFAGGAVAGAIDGGVKGAVVGGLLGALTGAIGGAALWGLSAVGGWIFGHVGRLAVNVIMSTVGAAFTIGGGLFQGLEHDNWDILAGAGGALVGAIIGNAIGNALMKMSKNWVDPNHAPRVKQNQADVQAAVNNQANFDNVNYISSFNRNTTNYGSHVSGVVTMEHETIGDSWLEYRSTQAHELYHEYQEQTFSEPGFANYRAAYSAEKSYASNRFENAAFDFEMRFMRYAPYPFATYTYVFGPSSVVLSQPPGWDNRKRGGDGWKDLFGRLGL